MSASGGSKDGTTRIRRFVTEGPVEAQVNLHEEHAQVIRRAISDLELSCTILTERPGPSWPLIPSRGPQLPSRRTSQRKC
jgi:hypothetical protein